MILHALLLDMYAKWYRELKQKGVEKDPKVEPVYYAVLVL